jgi:hypothetical protein
MESHLKKLNKVWEECQRDLREKQEKSDKPAQKSTEVKETESGLRKMELFD